MARDYPCGRVPSGWAPGQGSRGALTRIRGWAPFGLAALFAGSGTLHLMRPRVFRSLVPTPLPTRDPIIFASGIVELACAGALITRTRWAGPASALLLVLVFPGNVAFAADAARRPTAPRVLVAVAWARLPLQAPLIWAALQARPAGRHGAPPER